MTTRHLAAAILTVALSCCPAAAQSISDLFQKGIYTQETVGDLDGAIRIYRQIISAGADARAYAAQSQYRLGLCLKAKSDSAGATQAFQKLVEDYPDQKDLVAKAQAYLPQARLSYPRVSLTLPHGWSVADATSTSSALTVVDLNDPQRQAPLVRIWADDKPIDPSAIDAYFRDKPAEKVLQRRVGGGDSIQKANWSIRPQSIRRLVIGGQQAQSAIADYTEGGQPKIEVMTWIRTAKIHLIAFAQGIDAANLDDFQARFQPIVDSLVVP